MAVVVNPGKGVSSSAALEVATMQALNTLLELKLDGERIAALCQKVENCVAGVPCGIMDQMVCALGRPNELLLLRCDPPRVLGHVPVPPSLRFWGIDSGVQHAVGSARYAEVRAASFIGLSLLKEARPPHSFNG